MKPARLLPVIVIVFCCGCALIFPKEPNEEGLIGSWESVGMIPYSRMEFFSEGDGVLVFLNFDEDSVLMYRLTNYTELDEGFTVIAATVNGEAQTETLFGQFYGSQLAISSVAYPDFKTWYGRAEPVAKLRAKAEFEIKKYSRALRPAEQPAPVSSNRTTSKSL